MKTYSWFQKTKKQGKKKRLGKHDPWHVAQDHVSCSKRSPPWTIIIYLFIIRKLIAAVAKTSWQLGEVDGDVRR